MARSRSIVLLISCLGCSKTEETAPSSDATTETGDSFATTDARDEFGNDVEPTDETEIDAATDAAAPPALLTPHDATCSPAKWCWTTPKPFGGMLLRGWAPSPNELWAVSDVGDVVHVTDGGFSVASLGAPAYGVHGTGPNDVWFAAGDAAIRYDGALFWRHSLPTGAQVASVFARSNSDAWMVGAGGTIVRWDGKGWSVSPNADKRDLAAVTAISADDAWTVGNEGARLHFDGTNWSSTGSPAEAFDVTSVWAADATHVFAAGQYAVQRWDGAKWTPSTVPDSSVFYTSVWGTGATDVWATKFRLGGASLDHFDGTSWTTARSMSTLASCITGNSDSDRWLLGAGFVDHGNATTWTPRLSGTWLADPADVHGRAANDIWAIGGDGAMRWTGVAWTRVEMPLTDAWQGVFAIDENDVVAVGHGTGTIARFGGSKWTTAASGVVQLSDVWASGANDVWVVGNGGSAHWNGTSWTKMAHADVLSGVSGTASNDVWAVGAKAGTLGVVQHWNGTGWTRTEVAKPLTAVYARTSTDVWAVGIGGVVAHYDGAAWTFDSIDVKGELLSVIAFAADDVWISGGRHQGGSIIRHWNGSSWAPLDAATQSSLLLWGASANDLHAVAFYGALRRTTP